MLERLARCRSSCNYINKHQERPTDPQGEERLPTEGGDSTVVWIVKAIRCATKDSLKEKLLAEQLISRLLKRRRFLDETPSMEAAVFYYPYTLCATSIHTEKQMSTLTKNITTIQQTAQRTTPHTIRWSAEKTRKRLARSYTKLCTQSGPSPWAEIETTEE